MDWKWIVGTAIVLGMCMCGAVWTLVQVVVVLTRKATAIEVRLDMVVPAVQEMPAVKQTLAVHERRLNDQDEEVDKLRVSYHDIANRVASAGPRR